MWTINDFPIYSSMLFGWLACPCCIGDLDSFILNRSGKHSWFDNHSKFLELHHPFRRNQIAFLKNKILTTNAPLVRSGSKILSIIDHLVLKNMTKLDTYDINKGISQSYDWKKTQHILIFEILELLSYST